MTTTCRHASKIAAVTPQSHGCAECLESGDSWVHLRLCLTCGHVGCCDSSKNKHATRHFHATQHPVIRSLEPGEDWGWCYIDNLFMKPAPRPREQIDPPNSPKSRPWPELPYESWKETRDTLHRLTQIVGKIRLARMPMMNGWWQVPLYITARGLTTSPMPAGERTFQLDFDFLAHELRLVASDGTDDAIRLYPRSVARFYKDVMAMLHQAGLATRIWPVPVELIEPNPKPLDQDDDHASYDRDAVTTWWRILTQIDQVLKKYSSGFVGRISPVHFFWGTFDLAVSRYSGNKLPVAPDKNIIERYAFDMEQVECGFWPGDERLKAPAFFSFTVPAPEGYEERPLRPATARFNRELGEFILLYDDARCVDDPKQTILDFFASTYDAGARAGSWDRTRLEWSPAAFFGH